VVDTFARAKGDAVVGTRQQILCEGPSKLNAERLMGRTPQNKIVVFEGDPERHTAQLVDLHIQRSSGFTLYGEVVRAQQLTALQTT
jgi:tRNA-2-methylthio-N6-dimethylallyladenosine synthase